jgi:hypothetical protein
MDHEKTAEIILFPHLSPPVERSDAGAPGALAGAHVEAQGPVQECERQCRNFSNQGECMHYCMYEARGKGAWWPGWLRGE